MPESITIPASLDDAVETLNGLGELITARKWERSAIVAAFVRLSPGRGQAPDHSRLPNGESTISVEDFAALGIYGLTHGQAVRKYVEAWLFVNEGRYPRPGATRRLPNSDFPPMRTGTDGHSTPEGVRTTVERIVERHGPEAVAEVIEEMPRVRQAVTRTRLNRVVDENRRRTLVEQNRQAHERGTAADARMHTRLEHTGMVDHEATLRIRTARSWLRKAVNEYERNPLFTPEQRAETDLALAECEHLIALLRGEADHWSDDDREFLGAIGIEGADA